MSVSDHPIRIYVSHRFVADEEYLRVQEYLDGTRRFYYQLTSDPSAPVLGGREGQRDVWRQQIQASEVALMLSAHADVDPESIEFQVRFAKSAAKPVLLMRRFGSVLPPPTALSRQATALVDWNERAIVNALRLYGRQESTARWDTIDFTLD